LREAIEQRHMQNHHLPLTGESMRKKTTTKASAAATASESA
jgi:hypothetical protein